MEEMCDSGRGDRGNFHYTCKQDGHAQDNCYSLHGFPYKIAKVSQSLNLAIEQKIKSERNHLSLFSANEYKGYLQLRKPNEPFLQPL